MIFFEKEKQQKDRINGINIIYNNEKGCADKILENYIELASAIVIDDEGNEFFHNYDSYNDAVYMVCELANRGIVAKTGPAGPIKDYEIGRFIENPNDDQVGVYIVSKLEKHRNLKKKN